MARLLTAGQLHAALREVFPHGMSVNTFYAMLPSLPYLQLPGQRRKYYDLESCLAWLRSQQRVDIPPAGEAPLHRSRGRRLRQIA